MPFLQSGDFHTSTTTIRGVRYITNSFYSGDKNIFKKVEDLILTSYESSSFHENETESLVDDAIALDNTL